MGSALEGSHREIFLFITIHKSINNSIKKGLDMSSPYININIYELLVTSHFLNFLPKSRVDLKEFKQNKTRYGRNDHPDKEVLITDDFL